VDAAEGGGKGKGGFNGSALRGGRTASVLRAVGVPAAIANPIAAAVTAALATVVAVLKIRSNDIGLARGQEIQQEEREYSTYKSEREAATSVGEAEVQLTDKPIAAIDARNKIRERKRDLIEDSKNALPDQLPTGDWFDVFHPQKVMGKLLQFLDPRSGPNPHRDQDLKEIRDLDRQEMRASQITGPLTAEGRRAKMYYDQLVSAGADQTDAARIAKDAARRGDLERMGTATQGGARLASVAQQQADLAQGDVVRAIQDLPGRFAQEVASQLQRQHENPNARGPGGVMIHGAHVQGVSGW
jgi:hypothetical protein